MSARTSNGSAAGSVRMGPVTVITLVVVLCLAVLAVLALVTARASSAESTRQQQFVSASYSNDFNANGYLSKIDAALNDAWKAGESADAAMARVRKACPKGTRIEGRDVNIALTTKIGRMLTMNVRVNDDLTYTVTQWTADTYWNDSDNGNRLWSGK